MWAESGSSERSRANREIAKALGVEVKPGDENAMLAVLDAGGKLIASKSAADMIDEVRRRSYSVLKVQDFLNPHKHRRRSPRSCSAALPWRAKSKPWCSQHSGEFGDEWSTAFTQWLARPEVAKAMGPYVIVAVRMLRQGGDGPDGRSGGRAGAVAAVVCAHRRADGKPIVASQTEKTPNIGFPTDDGENWGVSGDVEAGRLG